MITFRSEIFPENFNTKISYSDSIFSLGSCFAENIGLKMTELKFSILINPFGIIYNPASIASSIDSIIQNKKFNEQDLYFINDKYISFNHHGRFSAEIKTEILNNINEQVLQANEYLKKSRFLFITFGTSWVFKLKTTNKIVANCHKLPSSEFEHYSLSVANIIDLYTPILKKIQQLNNHINIIFTVSPVRHWKNGAVQNQYSKSVLIVAIHDLLRQFKFCSYFPSYEIMMDDLRDYRFYGEDLFHPNQTGIDYIWNKFKKCYLSDESEAISIKIEKLNKSMQHRVFYPKSPSYKKFIESNLSAIKELKITFPELDFEKEFDFFTRELQKYFGN